MAFKAEFSRNASAIFTQLSAAGIVYDSVRVQLRGTPDTTKIVKDTTVFFTPSTDSLPIDLTVPVTADGQRFDAGLDYRNGGQSLYSGHVIVQSYRPGDPPPPPPPLVLNYTGPGANATRLTITPRGGSTVASGSVSLSVVASDATGNTVATPPIAWSVSDASLAAVSTAGTVSGKGRRGSVSVSAQFGSLSDQVTVTFTLPPSGISLVSGGGQSGKAGASLPVPALVQVSASDGGGVAGVPVIFSAPAGGAVTPTTTTTDANGRASASLRLGSVVGPQSFAATAAGFSVGIPATAAAGDASAISIVSGGTQSDTVRRTLAPLVVRVADQLNNPVAGATVSWARTSGSGALGAATSATDADGQATNSYTLGSTAGAEGVSASLSGVSGATVSFGFTAIAASPAAIAVVSGNTQVGRVNEALATPFVVRVTDAGNNPVSGATVNWAATNGAISPTSTTGADGQASATMTLGLRLGAASATASLANGRTATFTATSQPGVVAQIGFSTQPSNGIANAVLPAAGVALRDAGGNATTAANPVTISLGANPNGATLTGTLTRNGVNGVATFDDLKLDKIGSGYTLVATSGSLNSITSNTFNTSAGSAATMVVAAGDNQTAAVNAAVPVAPSVKLTDANNNPVAGVSVTFAPAGGSGSVQPSNGIVVTDAQGVATLTSWTLGTAAGAQTLTASAAGVSSLTFHATASQGNAAALRLTTAPPSSATSGMALSRQPVVQLTDAFGNAVPAGTMTVSVSSTNSAISIVNGGSVTVNSTTGVAAFSALTLSGTGTTTLVFREGSGLIQAATSDPITVVNGSASAIVSLAGDGLHGTVGTRVATAPAVKVTDASNHPVPGVAVAFTPAAGSGEIEPSNGVVITDALGVATLTSWTLGEHAGAQTLTASTSGLASINISAIAAAGAPTAMKITTSPSSSTTSGSALAQQPVVQILDTFGNAALPGTITVVVSSTNSNVSVFNGQSATPNATTGVAAFSVVTLRGTGTTRLVFRDPTNTSIKPDTSGTVTVNPGAASGMAVVSGSDGQSGTVGTAVAVAPAVKIIDAQGNPVPGVSVTFTPAAGSGVVSPTSGVVQTNALGVAALTSWTLGDTAGTQSLAVSATGMTGTTIQATARPGAAAALAFGPSSLNGTAGTSFITYVRVVDAFGNLATDATGDITLSLSPSTGTLAGTVTRAPSSGLATFTGLSIAHAATGYTLTATSANHYSPATSATFSITAAAPSALAFISQPTNVPAGSAITPAVVVQIQDAFGNVAANATNAVTITTSPTATLGGTTTVSASNSNATFSDLSLTAAGTYNLTAKATGLADATSSGFNVLSSGAVRMAAVNGTSYTGTAGIPATNPPGVKVTDIGGAGVAGVKIAATTTITGTSTVVRRDTLTTDATGQISLGGLFTTIAGSFTVTASNSSLSGGPIAFAVTINPNSASQLAFSVQPPSAVTAGVSISPAVKVQVTDAYGNRVTTSNASISLALHSPGGATLTGGGAVTAVSGEATFGSLSIDQVGTYQLDARTTGSIPNISSNSFTVSAGTVAGLSLVRGGGADAPSGLGNDSTFDSQGSGPKVQLVDAAGNPVDTTGVEVVASIVDVSSISASLSSPGPSAAFGFFAPDVQITPGAVRTSHGVANFSGAKLTGKVGDLAIKFSATVNGHTYTTYTGHGIHLRHGAAKSVNHIASLPLVVPLNHKLSTHARVQVTDVSGNVVDNGTVRFSVSSGSTLGGTTFADVLTNANGEAESPDWTVGAAGNHTLTATINGISAPKTVKASAPNRVQVTNTDGTAPSLHVVKNGGTIPALDATVTDADASAITDTVYSVSAAGVSPSGKYITIQSNARSSNSSGKTSFSGFTVDAVAQSSAQLRFTLDNLPSVFATVSLDSIDVGTPSVMSSASRSDSLDLNAGSSLSAGTFVVSIKDKNGRNDVSAKDVPIAWTVGGSTLCTEQLTLTAPTTIPTAANGRASSPVVVATRLFLGTTVKCSLTAHSDGYNSVTFTITPRRN